MTFGMVMPSRCTGWIDNILEKVPEVSAACFVGYEGDYIRTHYDKWYAHEGPSTDEVLEWAYDCSGAHAVVNEFEQITGL